MQFWFAWAGEVSIREQLVTQVVLGILSDDLAPGPRSPRSRSQAGGGATPLVLDQMIALAAVIRSAKSLV